jgi:hypothetical protein
MLGATHPGRLCLFKVKAVDHTGRAVTFACGTAEQALERSHELARRGFRDIVVLGKDDKEVSASALERSLDLD